MSNENLNISPPNLDKAKAIIVSGNMNVGVNVNQRPFPITSKFINNDFFTVENNIITVKVSGVYQFNSLIYSEFSTATYFQYGWLKYPSYTACCSACNTTPIASHYTDGVSVADILNVNDQVLFYVFNQTGTNMYYMFGSIIYLGGIE